MNDGRKRKGQKHQYKTAFKIQFDPLALEIHKKVSLRGYSIVELDYARDVRSSCNGGCNSISIKK